MHRQQGQQARCSDPSGYEWRVLEFRASSEEEPPTVRAVTATPESLGLAPRDVSLFAAIAGLAPSCSAAISTSLDAAFPKTLSCTTCNKHQTTEQRLTRNV